MCDDLIALYRNINKAVCDRSLQNHKQTKRSVIALWSLSCLCCVLPVFVCSRRPCFLAASLSLSLPLLSLQAVFDRSLPLLSLQAVFDRYLWSIDKLSAAFRGSLIAPYRCSLCKRSLIATFEIHSGLRSLFLFSIRKDCPLQCF